MSSASGARKFRNIQKAFQVIAALQLTAYMWPPQAVVQDSDTFDFIIVGAGTAGCVLAARLVEDKKTRVLLIEAGGDSPLESNIPNALIFLGKNADIDWLYQTQNDCYTSQCQTSRVLDLNLGKVIGGTGATNFLFFADGYYGDYNNWAKITNDNTWHWNNVRPYFTRAFRLDQTFLSKYPNETYYGSQGSLALLKDARNDSSKMYLDAFRETGNIVSPFIDAENSLGYSQATFTIGDGVRQSTAYSHLSPVKDYPNLYVLKNTEVTKILIDSNKNAVGVEAVTIDKKVLKVNALKEVIISAGAINSPKLLMLSGIGPKNHLKSININVISDLPVGQNFQDHVTAILIHNLTKLDDPFKTRDSRDYPAGVVTGFVNTDKTKKYPEYASVSFTNYAQFLIQFCSETYGLRHSICDAWFGSLNTNPMLFSFVTNIAGKSRGEVLLKSNNYSDAPIVNPKFYSNSEDLETMATSIIDFNRITETHSFKSIGGKLLDPKLPNCAKYKFASRAYFRCYALCVMTSRRHYAGTNAMGSVVDSRLKVIGVKKLRVVDASIMPKITRTDTFGPVVMIAEKASDMIKADNKMKIVPN